MFSGYKGRENFTNDFCPIVGTNCPHEPIRIIKNSFFIIEPFDENKENREKAIEDGLEKFYGPDNYKIITADRKITLKALFCDICEKIRYSQVCIADITPIKIDNISNGNKKKKEFYINENVILELGLAYGMKKPVILITNKVNGKNYIPSDLKFIRYLQDQSDFEYINWDEISNKINEILPSIGSLGFSKRHIPKDYKIIIKENLGFFKVLRKSIKYENHFNNKDIKIINFYVAEEGKLVALIKKDENLKEGMIFRIIKIENDIIEKNVGFIQIFNIQDNDIAQGYCIISDDTLNESIWLDILKSNGKVIKPFKNKLKIEIDNRYRELTVKELDSIIERYKLFI